LQKALSLKDSNNKSPVKMIY